jgi:hypothetical protein
MDNAERLAAADGGWSLGYETADAQHIVGYLEASMQATLALAFEQRTANLIALYGPADLANKLDTAEWHHVAERIKERLGLK